MIMIRTIYGRLSVILIVLVSVVSARIITRGDVMAATDKRAKFYLVGVGPGDPDLITLRGVRVIKEADLVFCSKSLKEKFAPYLEGKEVVHGYWRLFPYYGRDPSEFEGEERRECEEITRKRNEFIAKVRRAIEQGETVAVLDTGDPLIYGPSEWCLEEFEDLNPVVVPGLSSFNAANAALRRGIATSEHTKSVILTAADWPGKTDTIDKLSVHRSTMVLFTMRAEFKEFIEKLSINYPPQTPVAIVEHAGYVEKEEVIRGTLGTILDQIGDEKLPFEYLIYVGDFLAHRYKKAGKM
jgi:precorrin-4/cobalt-precorrin-4 C11-methyltransferase